MTALLSSKLIYNISKILDDNTLDKLDYFTSFAEKARGSVPGANKPFGHLDVLIRDWQHYESGWTMKQCKECSLNHLNRFIGQNAEATSRVERLKACFTDIDCFALCDPGKRVKNKAYQGKIEDIDNDFMHLLDSFAE